MPPKTPNQVRQLLLPPRWDPGVAFYNGSQQCHNLPAALVRSSVKLLARQQRAGKEVRALCAMVDASQTDTQVVANWRAGIEALRVLQRTSPIGTRREKDLLRSLAKNRVLVAALIEACAKGDEPDPSWLAVLNASGSRAARAAVARHSAELSAPPKLAQAIASFAGAPALPSRVRRAQPRSLRDVSVRADFWALMNLASQSADPELALAEALRKLPPPAVARFHRHLVAVLDRAYRHELWAAAYLLLDGCSDDGFLDFRCALVSRGQKLFERVLKHPDRLAEAPDLEADGTLLQLGPSIYEELTQQTVDWEGPRLTKPAGRRIDVENAQGLRRRFPKLAALKQAG